MRTRLLFGIAALLIVLLAALVNGWTPRARVSSPIARDSVTPSSNARPKPDAPAQPNTASTDASDFAVRARAAMAIPSYGERRHALHAIVADWMAVDPLACLTFLEGTAANDPMGVALSHFAIERWLALDEARAREWVLARVRSNDRMSEFYLQPVFAYTEKRGGVPALLSLLRELPTTDHIYGALTRIAAEAIILKMDQAAASEFIREVPHEGARAHYWRLLGSAIARKRGASILNQIASDGAIDGLPAEVGTGAVLSLLQTDLIATGRWLAQQPAGPTWDGTRFNQALLETRDSPELAVQTAALITDEQRRNELYRTALSVWAAKDNAAATEWAATSTLPADFVAAALVRGQVIRDPAHYERALREAAANASDEKSRLRAQFFVLQRWLYADRVAARKWIAASDLPNDMKQAILGVPP